MVRERLLPVKLEGYKPLRDLVFEAMRDAIVNGQLKPGERLMEIQLADELGVSRTPVREAIRKLELDCLVVMVPRKGAYVADISSRDIVEVFEVRGALERLAAGLCAERITPEELESLEKVLHRISMGVESGNLNDVIAADILFHDILYEASRNRRLAQIIAQSREQIQRFRSNSLAQPGRMKDALEEHRKILEAISQRDVSLAQRLAVRHVENAEVRLMEVMSQENSFSEMSRYGREGEVE